MSHRSLYRRYRPQTFEDVVGQTHVTRTLRNAVAAGTVAHAYLFTGPRGTGKTTTARLLAKALDCVKGPTPDPDNTCQDCIEIAEGRHPDVHELDAASRTGVDAVREEIIGRVNYAPQRGKWKIYIIDEVHMLSASAFNALLKTLEEPPSHTVFVLATTHPHKVPETIHSRCQRFDFHRLSAEDIARQLRRIADEEQISAEDAALALIARHAAGGMRDAIATFEQLAAFTGDAVTIDDVEGLLGEVDTALLQECTRLLADRDIAEGFRFVARLAEAGVDIAEFVRELTAYLRDVYVVSVVGDAGGIVDATAEDLSRLSSHAESFTPERLARALDLLADVGAEIRRGTEARLALEVWLTRMARPEGDLTLEALAERVAELEARTRDGGSAAGGGEARRPERPRREPAAARKAAPEPSAPVSAEEPAPAPSAPVSAEEPATGTGELDRAHVRRAWPAVLAELKKLKPTRYTLFTNTDVDVDGDELVVEFAADGKALMDLAGESDTLQLLRRAAGNVLGMEPAVRYRLGRGAARPAREKPAAARTAPTPATRTPAQATEQVAEAEADAPPVPETATRAEAAEAAPTAEDAEDVLEAAQRLLVEELGAEVIQEHIHEDE